jgi:nitrogen-specific signal transduction histidine kinase
MSGWRHDGRNRLAAIRNAAFYLKRRVSKTELWTSDPRVDQFFKLIEETLAQTDELLGRRPGITPDVTDPCASITDAVERAVAWARVSEGVRFDVTVAPTTVGAPHDELALAIRCLLENASEAMDGVGVVRVAGAPQTGGYVLEVIDAGASSPLSIEQMFEPLCSTKPGHLGLGLNIARRIALRIPAALEVEKSAAGTRVRLLFPAEVAPAGGEDPALP